MATSTTELAGPLSRLPPSALVALGAALGSCARWAVTSTLVHDLTTVGVNVVGSFILGLVLAHHSRRPANDVDGRWRLLSGTGFCGGFTTFSGFAVAVASDLRGGEPTGAVGVLVLTVIGCLAACAIGWRSGFRVGEGR